jgi:crossover junction endodeoxyribonuclease RuvC
MRILGIDPGFAICGYGVIEEARNGDLSVLTHGVIETHKSEALPQRLHTLRRELHVLIDQWQPETSAVEELFFATNAKTAITVGQARGVIVLSLFEKGLEIGEYTPLQVKQAVSGYGGADKKQMQEMVRILLQLTKIPKPDDAADALAIAITHAHSRRMRGI